MNVEKQILTLIEEINFIFSEYERNGLRAT